MIARLMCLAVVVYLAGVAVFGLGGCATRPEPRIVTKEVQVPVAVKCAADVGPEPAYADTPEALKAAPTVFERVQLLMEGRAQRIARIIELEAASAGCR